MDEHTHTRTYTISVQYQFIYHFGTTWGWIFSTRKCRVDQLCQDLTWVHRPSLCVKCRALRPCRKKSVSPLVLPVVRSFLEISYRSDSLKVSRKESACDFHMNYMKFLQSRHQNFAPCHRAQMITDARFQLVGLQHCNGESFPSQSETMDMSSNNWKHLKCV